MVDWDDDEVRWFGIKQTSKMTASNGLVGGICPDVLLGVSGNVFLMNKGTYDGSKTKVMFTLIDSQFASIEDSQTIEFNGQIDEFYMGVGGDGTLYGMAGGTIFKLNTKQPSEALILGALILPTAPVDLDVPWSGTAKAEVLTDVDDIDFSGIKPAYSTAYYNMCGDALSTLPPYDKCDLPLLGDGQIIVTGQTLEMPAANENGKSYGAILLYPEIVPIDFSSSIIKGLQIDLIENESAAGVWMTETSGIDASLSFEKNGSDYDVKFIPVGGTLQTTTIPASTESVFIGIDGNKEFYLFWDDNGVQVWKSGAIYQKDTIGQLTFILSNQSGSDNLSPPTKIEIISKPNEIMPLTLPSGITEIQAWCGEKIL